MRVAIPLVCLGMLVTCAPKPRAVPPRSLIVATARPEPEPAPTPIATGGNLRGDIDETFGDGGRALLQHEPGEQRFSALTLLPNGSIFAVGYSGFGGTSDIAVAHVLPDGALDQRFGDRGFLRVGNKRGFGQAITHDAKGRIVAAGYFSARPGTDMLLARFDAQGKLDPSFGQGGIVTHDSGPNDQPHAIFVQRNGRIVVVGYHSGQKNGALAFHEDGTPDETFGEQGVALFGGSSPGFATTAAMAPDGSIAAGGYLPHEHRGFVARIDARGHVDPAFGKDGFVLLEAPSMSSAWAVAVDGRGRVLLGGHTVDGPAALVRFEVDGEIDRRWGNGGVAIVDGEADDQFYALLFDRQERVVGVGFRDAGSDARVLVTRFSARGALDTGFGRNGTLLLSVGKAGTFAFDGAWDSEGRLVVSGDAWQGDQSQALLARIR